MRTEHFRSFRVVSSSVADGILVDGIDLAVTRRIPLVRVNLTIPCGIHPVCQGSMAESAVDPSVVLA